MNIESMSKMDKLVLISILGLELNQSMEVLTIKVKL